MLIDCPGCAKSYHLSRTSLEPHGRNVVCPRCAASWFVSPPEGEAEAEEAAIMEISAEAVSRKPLRVNASGADVPPRKRRREDPAFPQISFTRVTFCCLIPLVLVMAGIGWRNHIVRLWPQAATVYAAVGLPVNLRGLALHNVHVTLIDTGAEPVLGIEGEITNLKSGKNHVPQLRLSLRDAQSREIYAWASDAPKTNLAAGETLAFHSRLAAPPATTYSLLVSFAPAAHESLTLQ
jgi:predicted Zn finger-like uncharacterized protein